MMQMLNEIFSNPMAGIFMILNIIVLECLLSVDNAAVLATMVMDLPKEQRNKALRYGIIGAYLFRGIALIFVSFIVQIWWLKPLGGIYLLYLTYGHFKKKDGGDDAVDKGNHWLYKFTTGMFGVFWSTVILVEFMDMAFSIDNIFAVVAFSKNYILICFGVFIGILAMRFVAQTFVKLLEKYKFLETSAFVVIGILGLKLLASFFVHYMPSLKWIESEATDWAMSGITLLVFLFPLFTAKLFNWPKIEA
jgi:YkoY family integral membrane protein